MRSLRKVPAGLSHECGGQQRIPQKKKRNGVYSLLRVHKGLSHEGAALVHVFINLYCQGISSPGFIYAQSIFKTRGILNESAKSQARIFYSWLLDLSSQ